MEQNDRKAKTHKGRHVLESYESQQVETERKALFLKGSKCSQAAAKALDILKTIKGDTGVSLSKKNEINSLEDKDKIVFLANKNNCPIVCIASTTKKRGDAIIISRIFNNEIMEMFELKII